VVDTFTIDSVTLEEVLEFKYLGRTFSNKEGIEKEVEDRVNAGRRVLGGIRAITKSKRKPRWQGSIRRFIKGKYQVGETRVGREIGG